jgi:type II secretory pathway pseudopilin PulG
MRRGWALIELLAYVMLLSLLLTLAAMAVVQFYTRFHRVEMALDRIETASRFLDELKRDLRRAETIRPAAGRLDLAFEGGRTRSYTFDAATGDAATADGRAWFDFIERIAIDDRGATVAIDLELKRVDREAQHAPRISTQVACRGRKP